MDRDIQHVMDTLAELCQVVHRKSQSVEPRAARTVYKKLFERLNKNYEWGLKQRFLGKDRHA